jgi:hypothetical protein
MFRDFAGVAHLTFQRAGKCATPSIDAKLPAAQLKNLGGRQGF